MGILGLMNYTLRYSFNTMKINDSFKKNKFQFLASATLVILTIGVIFYYFQENLSLLDSLYFSVITLTTVGYGDISPQTELGKAFTIVYVIVGIGILFGFINSFADRSAERRARKKSGGENDD